MILYIYNERTDEYVACKAYETKNHFVSKKCLACEVNDNVWYIPLDKLSDEYDSSLRATIEQNDYQICTSLPINVINKYFTGGNLLVPLTSYESLYNLFVGMFGTFHVKQCDNGIIFKAPQKFSGITKMFLTGLNISVTFQKSTWTTTYNGTSDKYELRDNLISRSMLLKLVPGHDYLISFDDFFHRYHYADELVKNFIIIGYEVEQLGETAGNYNQLFISDEYFLYNEENHCINKIGRFAKESKYIKFIKDNYLKKDNMLYNFYLLEKPFL